MGDDIRVGRKVEGKEGVRPSHSPSQSVTVTIQVTSEAVRVVTILSTSAQSEPERERAPEPTSRTRGPESAARHGSLMEPARIVQTGPGVGCGPLRTVGCVVGCARPRHASRHVVGSCSSSAAEDASSGPDSDG